MGSLPVRWRGRQPLRRDTHAMIESLSAVHIGRDRARRYREYQNACGEGEDSQNSGNRSVFKFTFEVPMLGVKHFATLDPE